MDKLGTFNGHLLTPSHIGDFNRSRVIQAFCDHGPLSRAELAKMAGVTRATIGNIVIALLDAGVIEEGEPRDSTGKVGKRGRRSGLEAAPASEWFSSGRKSWAKTPMPAAA